MTPLLSIIVISHEQREELQRCLDSIFAMQLPFPHEIIVSDDRSTDGTREMLKEYTNERVRELTNGQGSMVVTYCNSDEGNCATNSLRSGYNRCNAYPLAKGKYIAHVDADDYFREGADVYVRQVEALEQHLECSLAMSNCLVSHDGEIARAKPWPFPRKMNDREIMDAKEFLSKDFFRLNQCFMQRRNPKVDPVALYRNRYVDSVITYHHLQFGKVIFVDACDYVYVRNEGSVTNTLAKQSQDHVIMWCLGLYIPLLIPSLSSYFFMGDEYRHIRDVIKLAQTGYKLQPNNYRSLQNLNAYIYNCFGRELSHRDMTRLWLTDGWMKIMRKIGIQCAIAVKILRKMLYN